MRSGLRPRFLVRLSATLEPEQRRSDARGTQKLPLPIGRHCVPFARPSTQLEFTLGIMNHQFALIRAQGRICDLSNHLTATVGTATKCVPAVYAASQHQF